MNPIIDEMEKEIIAGKELPQMDPGDTVKVFVRIIEGNKYTGKRYRGDGFWVSRTNRLSEWGC